MLLSGIFRWEVGKRPGVPCSQLPLEWRSCLFYNPDTNPEQHKLREMAAHGYLNPMISSSVEDVCDVDQRRSDDISINRI